MNSKIGWTKSVRCCLIGGGGRAREDHREAGHKKLGRDFRDAEQKIPRKVTKQQTMPGTIRASRTNES